MGSAPPHAAAHLASAITAMKKAMILRMPSQVEIQNRRVNLSCPPQQNRKTLLLELEDTLLCRRKHREEESDVEIGSGSSKFHVALLKKLKQYF
jgi:hypothetical protein